MAQTITSRHREGYPYYPSIIPGALVVLTNRLLGRQLSFKPFAQPLLKRVTPPVECVGIDNIPQCGGYVVTVNHYSREGLTTAWIAIALSALIPDELTWVMTEEWVFHGHPLAFILRPLMRAILGALREGFNFLPMPSVREGYSETSQRAAAVRRVVHYARINPQAVIALAPEGRDANQPGMGEMPAGVGKFVLHLNQMGRRILPVGITEAQGRLNVHFGEPYDLQLAQGETNPDERARAIIREQISRLIP
jgi:1-acyl-sn-glycerol-3-phosphate acyltransferase